VIGGHIVDAMDYIDNKILIFLLLRQWDNKDPYITYIRLLIKEYKIHYFNNHRMSAGLCIKGIQYIL
jgi:hypothetical protein